MLYMLSEIGLLECRGADAPIKADVKLLLDQREILNDPNMHHRLVS